MINTKEIGKLVIAGFVILLVVVALFITFISFLPEQKIQEIGQVQIEANSVVKIVESHGIIDTIKLPCGVKLVDFSADEHQHRYIVTRNMDKGENSTTYIVSDIKYSGRAKVEMKIVESSCDVTSTAE